MYCFRGMPVSGGLLARALAPPILVSGAATAGALVTRYLMPASGNISDTVATGAFLVIYVGVSATRPSVRDTARRVMTGLPILGGKNENGGDGGQ
jgi:hypothetical protein